MRVFVQVPQDVAPSVRVDVPATVTVREYPGRKFEGKVARTAGELDATTRTMNTEVRVPNPDGDAHRRHVRRGRADVAVAARASSSSPPPR